MSLLGQDHQLTLKCILNDDILVDGLYEIGPVDCMYLILRRAFFLKGLPQNPPASRKALKGNWWLVIMNSDGHKCS